MRYALAINCGSSSIKFQLINIATFDFERIAKGKAVGIDGAKDGELSIDFIRNGWNSNMRRALEKPAPESDGTDSNQEVTFEHVFSLILQSLSLALSHDLTQIEFVAHRLVHGGVHTTPVVINHGDRDEQHVLAGLDTISSFAPLHNTRAMTIVRATLECLPHAKSVLVFDTLFHQNLSPLKFSYPISPSPHPSPIPLRRYGFHGISYSNILNRMAIRLKKPKSEVNLIVAHLGAGSSLCTIVRGQSHDTTMGLTPLEGLPGATRSGSIDPALIFHHEPDASRLIQIDDAGRSISVGEYVLSTQCGFLGLTGTADFGEIVQRAQMNNVEARLCYNLFVDKIGLAMSGYVSELISSVGIERVDGIVFAGGIGEGCKDLRQDLMQRLSWIEKLGKRGDEKIGGIQEQKHISDQGKEGGIWEITKANYSLLKAFVVFTNEEEEMVRIAMKLV